MADPVGNITRLVTGIAEQAGVTPAAQPITADQGASTEKFTDMLSSMVNNVNDAQTEAAAGQQALMNGESVELHQVMIKAEEAGLSMDFLLEIRNKLVNAYNEVMRMPM